MTARARLGALGEEAAAALLEAKGFRIVKRNHRTRRGEVDFVADDGEVLAFVEVRTRASDLFGGPAASVGFHKQRRFERAVNDFLSRWKGGDRGIRFDVVAVVDGPEGPAVEHIPDAFHASC